MIVQKGYLNIPFSPLDQAADKFYTEHSPLPAQTGNELCHPEPALYPQSAASSYERLTIDLQQPKSV